MKYLLMATGLAMILLLTTGVILPWILNNTIFGIWLIIVLLPTIIFTWSYIFGQYFHKLIDLAIETFNRGK